MAKILLICVCLCFSLVWCQLEETCPTMNNEDSRCISIYQCEPYINFLKMYAEEYTRAVRITLDKVRCGLKGNIYKFKLCCPRSDLQITLPTDAMTTNSPQTKSTDLDPMYPTSKSRLSTASFSSVDDNGDPADLNTTCQTIENEVGRCISINQCEPYINFIKMYSETHTQAVGDTLEKVQCGLKGDIHNIKLCCPRSDFQITLPTAAPTTTTLKIKPNTLDPAYPTFESRLSIISDSSLVNGEQADLNNTCQTIKNEVGRCISINQCEPYINFIKMYSETHAQAVGDTLEKVQCGLKGDIHNIKVCCPQSDLPITLPTDAPTMTTPQVNPTNLDPADRLKSFPEPPECGYSKASFNRVVNGIPANLGDLPWMALLGYLISAGTVNVTRWHCGGFLVSSKHVVTAAHCTHNQGLYLVRLGELDFARDDEGAAPEDVYIKNKIIHEEYNRTSTTNDIAILVLAKEMSFSNFIRPVCIPTISELRVRNFVGHRPFVAGWGKIQYNGPKTSRLQVAQLRVISNAECAQAYAKYKKQIIDDRVLCASHPTKDACEGDSGGPLMILHKNNQDYHHFYVIGVVSFGKRCAEASFPGVYSRITHFIPWLEQKIISA